jgi:hypothetical protein
MKQLVIMPGGFHPFHAGHAALYQSAVEAFPGADVYVAATNDTSTRPFPFPVKEKLARGREWKDVDDTTYNRYIRWLSGPGPLRAARKLVSAYKAKYNAPKSDNSSWHNKSAVQM